MLRTPRQTITLLKSINLHNMRKLSKAKQQLLNILTDLYFASDNAIIGISFETFVSYTSDKDVSFITNKTYYNN